MAIRTGCTRSDTDHLVARIDRDGRKTLDPAWSERLAALTRPGWARTVAARRVAAALLTVLAAAMVIRGNPESDLVDVVIAGSDLTSGTVLRVDQLELVQRPSGTVPPGALTELGQVQGRALAGPAGAGETLTEIRLIGPRLAEVAVGAAPDGAPQDARIVPIRLADPGVAELIRAGDRVDVLAVATRGDSDESAAVPTSDVLARNAPVVSVFESSGKALGRGPAGRVVMLALPNAEANSVAAASVLRAVTVIFH